ncbi:MAG: hypothetical protein ABI721_02220 [Candidatus Dojkabacteria bacterium]
MDNIESMPSGLAITNAELTLKFMIRNTIASESIRGYVHGIIHEPISGRFFGRNGLSTTHKDGAFQLKLSYTGMIPLNRSPIEVIDHTIEVNQGRSEDEVITIICDEAILKLLEEAESTIAWHSENRFRLVGRPGGQIDIYIYRHASDHSAQGGVGVTIFE